MDREEPAVIEIKSVIKWYGSFQVLTDCSTTIKKGEVVVVCGPSGSGKSTLIKTVNALEPFQKGDITVDGISLSDPTTDLPKLRSRVGMVAHKDKFPGQLSFCPRSCSTEGQAPAVAALRVLLVTALGARPAPTARD